MCHLILSKNWKRSQCRFLAILFCKAVSSLGLYPPLQIPDFHLCFLSSAGWAGLFGFSFPGPTLWKLPQMKSWRAVVLNSLLTFFQRAGPVLPAVQRVKSVVSCVLSRFPAGHSRMVSLVLVNHTQKRESLSCVQSECSSVSFALLVITLRGWTCRCTSWTQLFGQLFSIVFPSCLHWIVLSWHPGLFAFWKQHIPVLFIVTVMCWGEER